jgi:hypothetical protein
MPNCAKLPVQCGLDENRLKDKATAKDEIINREEALYYYEDRHSQIYTQYQKLFGQ